MPISRTAAKGRMITLGGTVEEAPVAHVSSIRAFAWFYAALFVSVVVVGYIPALNDADGNLLGLFSLQWYDDALHLGSAIWAAAAAWRSDEASRAYFRIFGPLYFLDGVVGLLTGIGYLDLGIFLNGPLDLPLAVRIAANTPHLTIGGLAVAVGFFLPGRPIAARAGAAPAR